MNSVGAGERQTSDGWWWTVVAVQAGLLLVPLSVAWKLSPDAGHSWAVPMLMAYLYWERWGERPVVPPSARVPGWAWVVLALGVLLALPLRLFLEPFPLWPAMLAAYVFLCAGMVALVAWMAGGRPWLGWVVRPMVVLLAALLWPSIVQREFIQPVREGLATLSAEVLNLAGKPAIAVGTSLKLGTGWVGVDEACGGIRSLQAAVMIALFAGELVRLGWWRRGALLVIGVLAALLGNMCRTLFLAWQAAHSEEALHAMHDPAGWIALGLTMAGVGGMAWWWTRGKPAVGVVFPRKVMVAPLFARHVFAWAAAWIFSLGSIEVGTRWWFDRGASGRELQPRWTVRFPSGNSGFRPEPLADASRELLVPDKFEAASWRDDQGQLMSAYYLEWQKGQAARYVPFLHNPTTCLPLAGCELRAELGELVVRLGDLEIPFQGFRFRRAGEEFRVYFAIWDTSRAIPLRSAEADKMLLEWWKHQIMDVVEARRDQPAQLVTLAVFGDISERMIEDTLLDLLKRER